LIEVGQTQTIGQTITVVEASVPDPATDPATDPGTTTDLAKEDPETTMDPATDPETTMDLEITMDPPEMVLAVAVAVAVKAGRHL
jgi:hypothetical protein